MARPVRLVDEDEEAKAKAKEAELEKGRMPFLEHLRELRDRVRNAAIFFMAAFVVCWYFASDIYDWIKTPMFDVWRGREKELGGPPHVVFGKLTEAFWVDMSIGLWAGIFASSPFIFYQLWRFIAPGLYKRERRYTIAFAIFSAIFFVTGALFCFYFVLPNLYDFLLGYGSEELKPMIMMQDYLDLTRDMMLAFGAVFELPLLIYFLALVGLVTHRGLWKFNRWFIVLAFIIGAILTPSPDVVSQIMMATPMVILYNLSILLAWRVTVKRERKAREIDERLAREEAERKAKRKKKQQTKRVEIADDDEYEYEDVPKKPAKKKDEDEDE
jgi:sec-independent protein translocase protein TatC